MRSFVLGFLLSLSFVVGASCARPPTPVGGPSQALASLRGGDQLMTCTVEEVTPDEPDVAIVCTVPRDLSAQVRAILEGRAGTPVETTPPAPPPSAPSKVRR